MSVAARVAVIGAAGWAGTRHVRAFRALGARVVAVLDPSPLVHPLAESIDAAVMDSADDLRSEEVDLVVVALPSSMQPAVAADLLRRGHRVLIEKPLGSSAANVAVLEGIVGIDTALMVGYTLHHHPAAKRLREWVAGAKVIGITVRSAAKKTTLESWRTAPHEGGVAVVNGIHGIEYASSLIGGDATVTSAHLSNALHDSSVPDYVAATVSFENGPIFCLESYWNPWEHSTGLNRNDWSLDVDVIAREGRRLWSNWSLHEWDRHGSETVHHFPEVDLFLEQAKAALRFATGERPTVDYAQARAATLLADEILVMGGRRA